jgi:hypothetical protein
MLHSKQKAEPQNCEHAFPYFILWIIAQSQGIRPSVIAARKSFDPSCRPREGACEEIVSISGEL